MCASASLASTRPAAAPSTVSVSASTNSCERIRRRLAPRAVRTAISPQAGDGAGVEEDGEVHGDDERQRSEQHLHRAQQPHDRRIANAWSTRRSAPPASEVAVLDGDDAVPLIDRKRRPQKNAEDSRTRWHRWQSPRPWPGRPPASVRGASRACARRGLRRTTRCRAIGTGVSQSQKLTPQRSRVARAFVPAAQVTPPGLVYIARSTTICAGVAPRLSTTAPKRLPAASANRSTRSRWCGCVAAARTCASAVVPSSK